MQPFYLLQMLQERFREFARDTGSIGQERVDAVNRQADELINAGHSDAATIAEWKDGLNEAWADLLELIDTRTQILAASYELHKFYHDAKEILNRILDKHKKLPEELGRDQNTVETLQRMHTAFEHDIQALGTQVPPFHCAIELLYTKVSLLWDTRSGKRIFAGVAASGGRRPSAVGVRRRQSGRHSEKGG